MTPSRAFVCGPVTLVADLSPMTGLYRWCFAYHGRTFTVVPAAAWWGNDVSCQWACDRMAAFVTEPVPDEPDEGDPGQRTNPFTRRAWDDD